MKTLLFLLLLALPFLATAQQSTSAKYKEEIARHRAHEDSVFKFDEHSPLSAEAKGNFKGLNYFPVEEAYRVKAKFVRTAQETIFRMPTTGARTPEYVKYGELHFSLKSQPLKLSVYQNQELMKQPKYMTYLFIPFIDATTGQETYETGRYLDFTIPMGTDSVWLDFNKAYNPYCACGEGYSCPIPPKENKLPVRVEAGVKSYEKAIKALDRTTFPVEETMPEFPGGLPAIYKFLGNQFRVPAQSVRDKVSGTMEIEFTVKADGTLDDFQVMKSLNPEVDQELIRVAKKMPKWKPATQGGKPIDFRFRLPYRLVVR